MRLPRGTPVSPAIKTPPKNHADDGDAEKRLPCASATSTVVVSGEGGGEPTASIGRLFTVGRRGISADG
jgi:hypothetical protein